jgi:predicted RNA polymerase sigma factor
MPTILSVERRWRESTVPSKNIYNSSILANATATVETVYRADGGRIVATLIGLVGDFELAEECAQEAFTAAVEQWPAAGVPGRGARPEDTDWPEIVKLCVQASPIMSLNRAVAVAMAEGPRVGLALIDALAATNDLNDYHLLHAARADLLRRAGSHEEAAKSYRKALALVTNDSERPSIMMSSFLPGNSL